jgi:hypothetical protein
MRGEDNVDLQVRFARLLAVECERVELLNAKVAALLVAGNEAFGLIRKTTRGMLWQNPHRDHLLRLVDAWRAAGGEVPE